MSQFFGSGFGHDERFHQQRQHSASSQGPDLYAVMGVSRDATTQQIKRAYHKLCQTYHPDKNPGNEEKFKDISTAYRVLSDPKSREMYNKTGRIDGQGGASGGDSYMDAADIMNMMFNGGFGSSGSGRSEPRKQKTQDVLSKLKITLQQAYKGCTKRMRVTRERVCDGCAGRGGSKVQTCDECHGHGVVTEIRQMGPIQQRMQFACPKCKQRGEYVHESDKCKTCHGRKTCKKQEEIEINVKRGTRTGQRIPLRGKADEFPGATTGDLVFEVEISEHDDFKVQGQHLVLKRQVSLSEALLGTSFKINHVNGEEIFVKTRPGEVIQADHCLVIRDLGMPVYDRETMFGSLVIFCELVMPQVAELSPALKEALRQISPKNHSQPIAATDKQYFANQLHVSSIQEEQTTSREQHNQQSQRSAGDETLACKQQ